MDYFYVPSLVLGHLVAQLSLSVFILYKCCKIFRVKQLVGKATPSMILYVGFLTCFSVTMILYCIYAIAFWRPNEAALDQTALYIVGFIPWMLLTTNPVIEFGLCLDRCLTIAFPYQYFEKSKKFMALVSFLLVLFSVLINFWLNNLWYLPSYSLKCRFFTCCIYFFIRRPFLNPFKIFVSSLEAVAAVVLFVLIRVRTQANPATGKGKNRKNKTIIVIIITTIVFEFLPNLLDEIFDTLTGGDYLMTYIGPYRTSMSTFNVAVSAYLYARVFNPTLTEVSSIHVNPTISGQHHSLKKNSLFKPNSSIFPYFHFK